MIAFAIGFIVPFVYGIFLSFCKFTTVTDWKWKGLQNYSRIFFVNGKLDTTFIHSLWYTALFTVVSVLIINVISFLIAMALTKGIRGTNLFRTVFFLPFTTSVTAGAIIWAYLFSDIYAPIFGVVSPLYTADTTVLAMAIMASWRDMGYTMLIYIAALQTISMDYYEAATVEGANRWQQFIHITIPMIVPAFTTNITLILAWGLRTFDLPAVVSQTRPEGQTTAYYIYNQIFQAKGASVGQAAAILLTIILIVLTQIVTRVLRRLEVEA